MDIRAKMAEAGMGRTAKAAALGGMSLASAALVPLAGIAPAVALGGLAALALAGACVAFLPEPVPARVRARRG